MSGYDCRNKWLFSFWRNVVSDGADWTSTGRLFQSRGPAAANEGSPTFMCVKVIASQRWDVFETRCRLNVLEKLIDTFAKFSVFREGGANNISIEIWLKNVNNSECKTHCLTWTNWASDTQYRYKYIFVRHRPISVDKILMPQITRSWCYAATVPTLRLKVD